jgi:hypothetical protein
LGRFRWDRSDKKRFLSAQPFIRVYANKVFIAYDYSQEMIMQSISCLYSGAKVRGWGPGKERGDYRK